MKPINIIQPYKVGSKDSKSLAIVIPAAIREKSHIDSSTVFLIRSDNDEIILHRMNVSKEMIPIDQVFEAKDQQASIVKADN